MRVTIATINHKCNSTPTQKKSIPHTKGPKEGKIEPSLEIKLFTSVSESYEGKLSTSQ
jgi:hypothetical protein